MYDCCVRGILIQFYCGYEINDRKDRIRITKLITIPKNLMRPKYITLTTRLITVNRMINAENPMSFLCNKAGQ